MISSDAAYTSSSSLRHQTRRRRIDSNHKKSAINRWSVEGIYSVFCGLVVLLYLWANYSFLHQSSTASQHQASVNTTDNTKNSSNDLQSRFEWGRQQITQGGAFVHIGKTGGSSLSVLLRNGCHSWLRHPCRQVVNETTASRLIQSYYHVADFGLLPQSHHDFYVLTLRDPYDRTISAFVYEHFRNVQARGEVDRIKKGVRRDVQGACDTCFATLEQFVARLGGHGNEQSSAEDFVYPHHQSEIAYQGDCHNFTRAVFHGRVRIFHHLFFNYRKIKSLLPRIEDQTLLVTRLEYLWHDWDVVNAFLGTEYGTNAETVAGVAPQVSHNLLDPAQSSNTNEQQQQQQQQQHIRNTARYRLPVTRDLSPRGRNALCRALQPEYDAYFWLLSRARNLHKDDLIQSLLTAKQKCPGLSIDFKALQKKKQ